MRPKYHLVTYLNTNDHHNLMVGEKSQLFQVVLKDMKLSHEK